MGTIVFEDYQNVGISGAAEAPLYRDLRQTTVDATTSTTAESYTAEGGAQYISVYAVEAHRVSIVANTVTSVYHYIAAGERRDIAIPKGGVTIYYRLDA